MAHKSLPKKADSVPISREEFDQFVNAQAGIETRLWIMAELTSQLRRRFNAAAWGSGHTIWPRRN